VKDSEGRARPPGGPLNAGPSGPVRANLNHVPPAWVSSGAMFFVTVCCERRGVNQLSNEAVGVKLLESAQFYHNRGDWFARLFLVMPDHVHALIAPAPDKILHRLLGDWKRFTTTQCRVTWQKNFIDHRLRSHESWDEKANYIRMNPRRAGLITPAEKWPYILENSA